MTTLRPLSTLRSAWAFIPHQWWRRPPFLPLPDRSLIAFRMETAYGSKNGRPPKGELGRFLDWTVAMRRFARQMPRVSARER